MIWSHKYDIEQWLTDFYTLTWRLTDWTRTASSRIVLSRKRRPFILPCSLIGVDVYLACGRCLYLLSSSYGVGSWMVATINQVKDGNILPDTRGCIIIVSWYLLRNFVRFVIYTFGNAVYSECLLCVCTCTDNIQSIVNRILHSCFS